MMNNKDEEESPDKFFLDAESSLDWNIMFRRTWDYLEEIFAFVPVRGSEDHKYC